MSVRFEEVFAKRPAARAQAPGRVNLIGEHTDYSGGLVLPAAISLGTRVSLRYRDDGLVRAVSRERGRAESPLAAPPGGDWLDYPRGVARVLAAARRIPASGFDLLVESDLPVGAGLSSSAALEVATALALAAAAGAPVREDEREQLAVLCRRAENDFAGAPCGIMDQYAVACARESAALLLDCARVTARAVALPDGLELLVCDTGVRRELRDGFYETRVRECERARTRAAALLARPLDCLSEVRSSELPRMAELEPVLAARLRHVVTENERVARFVALLEGGDLEAAGALLYDSHRSLADDYAVSWPEADRLVAGSAGLPGVLGARMTGAGLGGCTLHLLRGDTAAAAAGLQALGASRVWPLRIAAGARTLPAESGG